MHLSWSQGVALRCGAACRPYASFLEATYLDLLIETVDRSITQDPPPTPPPPPRKRADFRLGTQSLIGSGEKGFFRLTIPSLIGSGEGWVGGV